MAKDKRWNRYVESEENKPSSESTIAHTRPFKAWMNFDSCWSQCVKNSNPTAKEAAKAHLQSLGVWDDQSQWIDALIHFGLRIEE